MIVLVIFVSLFFFFFRFFGFFFFLMIRRPPRSTLFPYTRSSDLARRRHRHLGDVDLRGAVEGEQDRKSTRLNSSHMSISYAVFCLKKKKKQLHNFILNKNKKKNKSKKQ